MSINLTEVSRELRKNSTDAERLLWKHLKAKQFNGLKFRRQEQIGRFIADFVCYEKSVIIEADGSQHALEKEKDEERTQWLNSQGFSVLRFWNNEILTNIYGVIETIWMHCNHTHAPSPQPSPTRGEGAKNLTAKLAEEVPSHFAGELSESSPEKVPSPISEVVSISSKIKVPSPLVGEG